MIKFLVALIITAVAGLIGYHMLQPVCPGGQEVHDMKSCQAAGLSAAVCKDVFARTDRIAKTSGVVFPNRMACEERYPTCLERSNLSGWSPRPASWCIVPSAAGPANVSPVYSTRP